MRLPKAAYDYYLELGPERSYQAVADHFGTSKAAVVNRASKEDWQGRLRAVEDQARRRTEQKAVEGIEAVRERQLKAARLVQGRALEAIQKLPAEKAVRAAAVLNLAWKHELLLLGEPTDRQANIEEITKREMARWLVVKEDDPAPGETG